MKREEMIDLLESFLSQSNILSDYYLARDNARDILEFIEGTGMLPPPYTCINESQPEPTSIGSCKLHKWEPKDET